eukprot:GHRQ01032163.1.p1 GENE.GHRQ01032163.1~~GHRQ01032163.1.p1  ORF type:complete len:109 (+),score=12.00 GHRQ01032163.1:454-780(+)
MSATPTLCYTPDQTHATIPQIPRKACTAKCQYTRLLVIPAQSYAVRPHRSSISDALLAAAVCGLLALELRHGLLVLLRVNLEHGEYKDAKQHEADHQAVGAFDKRPHI